jgi:hypothetical protein
LLSLFYDSHPLSPNPGRNSFITSHEVSDDDVLPTPTERKDRLKMLLEAIRKAEKQEVVLHVRTNGLVHRIQSRIFDTWSGLVLINKGLTIPLACIAQVEHIA